MSELKAFDITVAEEGYCEGFVKYRRATNRELSRWLAQGNGECLGSQDDADTAWNYPMESSNAPLREGAKVRKWSDTEWHEPTVDYMGLEDK